MTSGNVSASCKVTVIQPVTSIYVGWEETWDAGKTQKLTAYVYPDNATNPAVTWKSSDEEVVSVSEDGVATAHKIGTAVITATAIDGSNVSGSMTITVKGSLHIVGSVAALRSSHPYENNCSDTWQYTDTGKKGLKVTFNSRTYMEEAKDYLYVYDGKGNLVGEYTGAELAGKNVLVQDDTVKIKLLSDDSGTAYGFAVEKITENNPLGGSSSDEPVEIPDDEPGEVIDEDIPEGGIESIPDGLWIAGIEEEGYDYTGAAVKPSVRVYDHKTLLVEKKDYTIAYKNNKKAQKSTAGQTAPCIIVTGKGNYTGKATKTFTINPLDINGEEFDLDHVAVTYNSNKVQKVIPTLLWKGKKLKNTKDFTVSYPSTENGAYKNPGTYIIRVKGINSFSGTKDIELYITSGQLMSKVSVKGLKNQTYTGNPVEPAFTVKHGKNTLVEGTHYTVSYEDNTKVGTAYVVLTGINGYSGQKRVSFKITGQNIKNAKIKEMWWRTSGQYNGHEQTLQCTLKIKVGGVEKTLVENTDYTVSYLNNVNAGKAFIIFTGINGYTGTLKKAFSISKYYINNDYMGWIDIESDITAPYRKGGSKPKPTIVFRGVLLEEGVDYTLTYKNNKGINDGKSSSKVPIVVVKGKGNFAGSKSISFEIAQQDIGNLSMVVADKVYSGKKNGYKSVPKIVDLDGKSLAAKTDYMKDIEYRYKEDTRLANGVQRTAGEKVGGNDIVPTGTVIQVTVYGTKNYTGQLTGEYRILGNGKDISKAKVGKIPDQYYTGRAITLTESDIKVKIGTSYLDETEFEIVEGSYKNNIKKGKASVTIRGIGAYGGTKTVTFNIKAKTFAWWKALSFFK